MSNKNDRKTENDETFYTEEGDVKKLSFYISFF